MRTASKPAHGCLSHGFTFLDAHGNLAQISWAELREQNKALYVHDGTRWRRLRDVRDAAGFGDPVRLAIAALDADDAAIAANALSLEADLLTGAAADRLGRLRELAALDPVLVEHSNAWRSLSGEERGLVLRLRQAPELSDRDLLRSRGPEDRRLTEIRSLLTATGVAWSETDASSLLHAIEQALPEGFPLRDAVDFLVATPAHEPSTLRERLEVLGLFADSPDPLGATLGSIYGLPDLPRPELLAAARLLRSCTLDAASAARLVTASGLRGTDLELGELAATVCRNSGGDIEKAAAVVEEYRRDPEATVRTHGSNELLLARRFPALPATTIREMASFLAVHPSQISSARTRAIIDAVDPDLFARVHQLTAGTGGGAIAGDIDMTLRAIAAFGERAPEWLRLVAESERLDRERLLGRLPDADTAARQVARLSVALAAPPPSREELALAARRAGIYRGLHHALKEDRSDDAARVLATIADEDLQDLLPNSGAAVKRVKEIERQLAGELEPDVRAALEREAGFLTEYSRALKRGDEAAVPSLLAELRADDSLLAGLLPPVKTAAQRSEELARTAVSAGEEIWDLAHTTETTLWGTATLEAARAGGELLGEDLEAKRRAQERELDLWRRYSLAMVEGDEENVLTVGAELRPDRSEGTARVSVHDAVFWLPANIESAHAPDGTRLGDWLLDQGRGASALRSAAGPASLQAVASAWNYLGGKDARIHDIVDRHIGVLYGGHDDPASRFFATHKVEISSAEVSARHLLASRETPTLLPLDLLVEERVDTDDASTLRGYFLPRTDPRGMQLGMLTDCCQHPASAGATCAFAGQTHPASGFFVVEDEKGTVLAQSWVWAATDAGTDGSSVARSGVVFDNIEARLHGASPERRDAVRAVYDRAAESLLDRFDRVLVGAGGNDVPVHDLAPTQALDLESIAYRGYSSDSRSQLLWRERPERSATLRVLPRSDGFDLCEGGSTARVVVPSAAERLDALRLRAEQSGLSAAQSAALEREITALDAVHVSARQWQGGTTPGDEPSTADADVVTVELAGPNARELALRELSRGTARSYVFVHEDGSREEVFVDGTHGNGMSLDVDRLPVSYAPSLEPLARILVEAGVPEQECRARLLAAAGKLDDALRSWRLGWSVEQSEELASSTGRPLTLHPGFCVEPPPAPAEGSSSLPLTDYVNLSLYGDGGLADAFRTDPVLRERVLGVDARRRQWDDRPHLRGVADSASQMGQLVAVLRSREDAGEHVSAVLATNPGRPPSLSTFVHAERAVEEGLTSGDIALLLGKNVGSTGLPGSRDRREAIAHPGLREALRTADGPARSRLVEELERGDAHQLSAEEVLALAERTRGDVETAVRFDRQYPLRTLTILESAGLVGEDARDDDGGLETVREQYRIVRKHLSVAEGSLETVQDLERSAARIERARANCMKAGIQPQLGESMPDYYFSQRDLDVLGTVPEEKVERAMALVNGADRFGQQDLVTVLAHVDDLFPAALTEIPEQERPSIVALARSVTAGTAPSWIREALESDVDPSLRSALATSPVIRRAVEENAPSELLEMLRRIGFGTWHPDIVAEQEPAARWLLDYVRRSPEHAGRVTWTVATYPYESCDALVREILKGEELPPVLGGVARGRAVFV